MKASQRWLCGKMNLREIRSSQFIFAPKNSATDRSGFAKGKKTCRQIESTVFFSGRPFVDCWSTVCRPELSIRNREKPLSTNSGKTRLIVDSVDKRVDCLSTRTVDKKPGKTFRQKLSTIQVENRHQHQLQRRAINTFLFDRHGGLMVLRRAALDILDLWA